jgi:hypothetical protein
MHVECDSLYDIRDQIDVLISQMDKLINLIERKIERDEDENDSD